MRQAKTKPLSQILLANMLLVATLSCALIGCLGVIQETFRFNSDIVAMRDSMISARKQRMKEQVDRMPKDTDRFGDLDVLLHQFASVGGAAGAAYEKVIPGGSGARKASGTGGANWMRCR